MGREYECNENFNKEQENIEQDQSYIRKPPQVYQLTSLQKLWRLEWIWILYIKLGKREIYNLRSTWQDYHLEQEKR